MILYVFSSRALCYLYLYSTVLHLHYLHCTVPALRSTYYSIPGTCTYNTGTWYCRYRYQINGRTKARAIFTLFAMGGRCKV